MCLSYYSLALNPRFIAGTLFINTAKKKKKKKKKPKMVCKVMITIIFVIFKKKVETYVVGIHCNYLGKANSL